MPSSEDLQVEQSISEPPRDDEFDRSIFDCFVNLEDLSKEETLLWELYQEVCERRSRVSGICQKWWKLTENSSVKDMQDFFEEEKSKRLMKTHQVVMIITIAYAEHFESELRQKGKLLSAIKNLLANVHQNFLIFVDFIVASLNDEQRNNVSIISLTEYQDWAAALLRVLAERPNRKSYYKAQNATTLKKNNDISLSLLKGICMGKTQDEFLLRVQSVFRSIESSSGLRVRELLYPFINSNQKKVYIEF